MFSLVIVFQLVTLPVEFNASRRAMAQIRELGLVTDAEAVGARQTLTAAAMTYVAGALASIAQLHVLPGDLRAELSGRYGLATKPGRELGDDHRSSPHADDGHLLARHPVLAVVAQGAGDAGVVARRLDGVADIRRA